MSGGNPQAVRDYAQVEARLAAATQPPILRRSIGQQAGQHTIWEVKVPAAVSRRRSQVPVRVLLSAGTHGDEPAGVEALLQFLEQRRNQAWPHVAFTILPCLNPWGYSHDQRENPAGADLNRCYRRAPRRAPEVSAVKRSLGRRRFTLTIDCHENCDASGFYTFELPTASALGTAAVRAVGAVGPTLPDGVVEDVVPVRDGIARPEESISDTAAGVVPEFPPAVLRDFATFVRTWPAWPLAVYLWRYRSKRAFTFETPTQPPLGQRAEMHMTALEGGLNALVEEHTRTAGRRQAV